LAEDSSRHIVSSYDAELQRLDALLAEMGGRCEEQLRQAVTALKERNPTLATETVGGDIVIDALEREVEGLILRLLALRQPVAIDLRHTLAALKAAAALERAGDHAKNVAKSVVILNSGPPLPKALVPVISLAQLAGELLHAAVESLIRRDQVLAADVWQRDRDVDNAYAAALDEIYAGLAADPASGPACLQLQLVAKNLERIGDLATNVAEMVQFEVTGRRIDEERPRGDTR
jgi:phosphate transport system protein